MFYEKISEKWDNTSPEIRKNWEKILWVATEKIHGANFSIHIEDNFDKKNVQFAKRKEFLNWEDDFFSFQILANDLSLEALKLFRLLNDFFLEKNNTKIQKIIIYGELCGGEYPHPQVEKLPQYQAIQTGVYYSNDIRFFAFDVRIFTENSIFYLDYKDFLDFLPKTNFLTAPFYLVDKLHKILQFDLDKSTPIPSLLGFSALSVPNFIEGIVIKPYQHSLLGEENTENPRPIFKLKRKEFLENPTYQEAKKWENITENTSENTWQDVDFWITEILPYLNKNRLESTISKIGNSKNPTSAQLKNLATHWADDSLESFREDYPHIWQEITPKIQEHIRQKLIFDAGIKL